MAAVCDEYGVVVAIMVVVNGNGYGGECDW